jgi:ATP adenylyltransferase/5',5'''-P-1,P-4-tetraphosphate phosphorylase II
MASIKNLKKDINYVLGDIIQECYDWQLEHPKADTTESEAIIDDTIETFDELIAKVHAKDVENRKEHFKAINVELEKRATDLLIRVNKL